jgi:hypothetical protein
MGAESKAERARRVADEKAQETAGVVLPAAPRLARTHVHATRADGVKVVFLPGELIPAWVPDSVVPHGD